MTIKPLLARPLIYAAALSGIALGFALIFMPHSTKALPSWGDIVLSFSAQLLVTVAIGYIVGFILKNKVSNSYLISIIAMLYLYDAAAFLVFTRGFGYVYFILLLALVSVCLFAVIGKLFNKYSLHKKRLATLAVTGSIILWFICASLGVFLMRVIASLLLR